MLTALSSSSWRLFLLTKQAKLFFTSGTLAISGAQVPQYWLPDFNHNALAAGSCVKYFVHYYAVLCCPLDTSIFFLAVAETPKFCLHFGKPLLSCSNCDGGRHGTLSVYVYVLNDWRRGRRKAEWTQIAKVATRQTLVAEYQIRRQSLTLPPGDGVKTFAPGTTYHF